MHLKVLKPAYFTSYDNEYIKSLKDIMDGYNNVTILPNRDYSSTFIESDYFIKNDVWNIDFFKNIEQYKEFLLNKEPRYKNISFVGLNYTVSLELKAFMYNKLFKENITIGGFFGEQATYIHRVKDFIIAKYPDVHSVLDINLNKVTIEWTDWLNKNGIKTTRKSSKVKNSLVATPIVNFLPSLISTVKRIGDDRIEWEKDIWDVRNLKSYGIRQAKTSSSFYLNFERINNINIRNACKVYFKKRMLDGNPMAWKTACSYMELLPIFLNFISEQEPTWNDLKKLERSHIEEFYIWLKLNIFENPDRNVTSPTEYQRRMITYIKTTLNGLQEINSPISPENDIRRLILKSDLPRVNKGSKDNIKYIPDSVLQQLFEHIDSLNPEVIPVVWIMYKTGLRVTDVLELNHDCLVKINGEYWIVTDIEKVYVSNHRIPIDEELASMIAVLIDKSKKESNKHSNPHNLIFGVYSGSRKGMTHTTDWVNDNLNILAEEKNIIDENNKLFKFHNHAFRHTYAVKMLNSGVDILTLQDLLAHASPEMTLRYARLLDETKRKAFNKAITSGVFTINENLELSEVSIESIDEDLLKDLWTNHKLNALDTPYGTCMQRAKGGCDYAKAPPCLVGNGGKPCKDLFIGACNDDKDKYKILLESSKGLIEIGKKYNRPEIIKENTELLNTYQDILSKLEQGDIIYGRLDRLKK